MGKLLRLSLLLIVILAIYIAKGRVVKPQTPASLDSVPEMKEILGPDQEARLKAGRKLVERVGVEQALEILNNSPLPHTGEGHLVVHQIGFYAYQKYGAAGILHCKDYFLYACYHGVIIEAASKGGFSEVAKMTDLCRDSPLRYFQCLHAAGHSIMAIWNYDLSGALKTCDDLYGKEPTENLASCHNGAFMENLFGVHDWGTGKTPKRDWLSNDPYFPCNAFPEKYQRGCWLNQAARIYQLFGGDLVKTAQTCKAIGNDQYTYWCLDNLSRQIHAMTNGDVARVFALCQTLGADWRDQCVVVNAGAFYSVGGRGQAMEVCHLVVAETKAACYQNVFGQMVYDTITYSEKLDLCKQVEPPYSSECYSKIAPLTTKS